MNSIFTIILWLHIAAGSTGLIAGLVSMLSTKGKKIHLLWGKIFFYAMVFVFITSVYMSIVKSNIFLLLIGFFSIYLAATGYRILSLKKLASSGGKPAAIDYLLGYTGIIAGFCMYGLSVFYFMAGNLFGIVLLVFGTVALSLGYKDLKNFSTPPLKKTFWLSGHAIRMGGAFTATVTAFIVVNFQIQQQWILWILPTIVIIPFTRRTLNQFLKGAKKG